MPKLTWQRVFSIISITIGCIAVVGWLGLVVISYADQSTLSTQPDLVVHDILHYPGKPLAGDLFQGVGGVVKNQGNVKVSESSTRLRIDIQNEGTWDILPANNQTGVLRPGDREREDWVNQESPQSPLIQWTATPGSHKIEICADSDNQIAESDETNNCAYLILPVPAGLKLYPDLPDVVTLPDLTAGTQYAYGAEVVPGDPLTIGLRVGNGGLMAAGPSYVRFRLDVGDDDTWDVIYTDLAVGELAPNDTYYLSIPPWIVVEGVHKYEVCADIKNTIAESNEDNNCSQRSFVFPLKTDDAKASLATTPQVLDIAIIGDRYEDIADFHRDVATVKNFLFSLEPFQSRQAEIKIWAIDNKEDLGCYAEIEVEGRVQHQYPGCNCDPVRVARALSKAGVPYDKYIILVNGLSAGSAGQDKAIVGNGFSGFETVFAHELAHTLGLYDEYQPLRLTFSGGTVSDSCNANCCFSAKCTAWKEIEGAQCIAGCTYAEWYRSSEKSIMSGGAAYFNVVSQRTLNRTIDQYTRDKIPPRIGLLPLEQQEIGDGAVSPDNIPIIADASDNIALSRLEFFVDDVLLSVHKVDHSTPQSAPSSQYVMVWSSRDRKQLTPGSIHTVFAKAYDLAGNVSPSPSITIKIKDTNEPEPLFNIELEPPGDIRVSGVIKAKTSMPPLFAEEILKKLEFYVDDTLQDTLTTAPYVFSWNTALVTDGEHLLQMKAVFKTGDIGVSTRQGVIVKNGLPLVQSFRRDSVVPPPRAERQVLRNLRYGSQGEEIKILQQLLSQEGVFPDTRITGYFGPLTRRAVIFLQEKYADEILTPLGLSHGTGFVGPRTLQKLNELRKVYP